MAPWGSTSSNKKLPTWLNNVQITDVFASARGWVHRHWKGTTRFWDELLVTGNIDLANNVSNSVINYTYFANSSASYVQGNANAFVSVVFNKSITVTGSPTLNVVGGTTNATATYNSGTGSNKLLFKFTVPAATQTLSIPAQSVTLAGGTLVDSTGNNAVLTIGAGAVIGLSANGRGLAGVATKAVA